MPEEESRRLLFPLICKAFVNKKETENLTFKAFAESVYIVNQLSDLWLVGYIGRVICAIKVFRVSLSF